MEVSTVLATILLLTVVGSSSGEHVRKVIHVPQKIHTIHHHNFQRVAVPVPVVKHVPIYKAVEVPIVMKVPVIQKVPVAVPVPVSFYNHNQDYSAIKGGYSGHLGNFGMASTKNGWQWK